MHVELLAQAMFEGYQESNFTLNVAEKQIWAKCPNYVQWFWIQKAERFIRLWGGS